MYFCRRFRRRKKLLLRLDPNNFFSSCRELWWLHREQCSSRHEREEKRRCKFRTGIRTTTWGRIRPSAKLEFLGSVS
ncbi:hypothetical protein AHAS_Ahas15G0098300 [Arachis hypogaea]